jgi:Tol biopolymer transport system component
VIAMREKGGSGSVAQYVLLPTGVGQEKVVATGALELYDRVAFHPDGKRIFFSGAESGHDARTYELELEGGTPKPLTPEGVGPTQWALMSQDGSFLLARTGERSLAIYSTNPNAGVSPRAVTLESSTEMPVHWSADGRSILIADGSVRPIRVDRLDLASGRRSLWRTLSAGGLMGVGGLNGIVFSANEDTWVVGYTRRFSELLVIDGLK